MSSPVAHVSLMLLLWPQVSRRLPDSLSRRRRMVLGVLVLGALMGPDADLVCVLWAGTDLRVFHNHFTHSFLLAPIFGVLFGTMCRLMVGGRWYFFAWVGLLAYVAHILLDAATWGRGVQLAWPISNYRFSAPFPLFYGVRHSVGAPWSSYFITIANDLAFAAAVWMLARWLNNKRLAKDL